MRRLLVLAATAAAVAVSPLSADAAIRYDRPCGGIVDAQCAGWTCTPVDCFPRQCLVWIDPLHSPYTAVCISPVG